MITSKTDSASCKKINIMIKNMLERRKESDSYLATCRRHCWSAQMTMKKDN